ncbi:MAG: hypothetical protein ACK5MQ_00785 [Pikeienuella sp.]
MRLSALVYCLALGGAMLFALWFERKHGGGNHWVYFGTPLDRLIQSLGLPGLLWLCAPPAVVAAIALAKSRTRWAALLAAACIALATVTRSFAIMALD